MAESKVDITADREKAAAAGKAAAKAFADSFAREVQATQKLGRMQSAAYAEDERRTAAKSRAKETEHRKEVQRTQQMGRIQAQAFAENERRDESRRKKAQSAERAESQFRTTAARDTARFVQQEKRAAGQAFFDKRDGVRPMPKNWVGDESQWRGMERQRIDKKNSASRYLAGGALGLVVGLGRSVMNAVNDPYQSFRGYRQSLGDSLGPLSALELERNNRNSESIGSRFGVTREQRFGMQNALARATGSGEGVGHLMNVTKGGLGLSSGETTGFLGDMKRWTGSQGKAIWEDFGHAMQAADKAGIGRGQFAKALAPLARIFELSARMGGGDASASKVAGIAGMFHQQGFRRTRGMEVAANMMEGSAANAADPFMLQLHGAREKGGIAAWYSAHSGTKESMQGALRRLRSSGMPRAQMVGEMMRLGLAKSPNEAEGMLFGGAGMQADPATGLAKGDFGARASMKGMAQHKRPGIEYGIRTLKQRIGESEATPDPTTGGSEDQWRLNKLKALDLLTTNSFDDNRLQDSGTRALKAGTPEAFKAHEELIESIRQQRLARRNAAVLARANRNVDPKTTQEMDAIIDEVDGTDSDFKRRALNARVKGTVADNYREGQLTGKEQFLLQEFVGKLSETQREQLEDSKDQTILLRRLVRLWEAQGRK